MSENRVTKLHDDEVDIDASLVTRLLAEQFPRWAGAPVRLVTSSGTDNVTFRVGPDLAVRLPRTAGMRGQVEKDLRWLPHLAPKLPLAVPQPLALGSPNEEFPFSWGVYRWLEGTTFRLDQLADPAGAARELAEFLHCLQEIDTDGAPVPPDDPFSRGTPLAPRDGLFRAAVEELRDDFDTGLLLAAWEASLEVGAGGGAPRWIHGDLMPGNVLVADGRLTAIIDFATACAADPAADLLAAWYLFDGDSRRAFRDALKVDEHAWVRARGWTLSLTVISLPYYRARNPAVVRNAAGLIAELLADFATD
ncbi:aminoglycoside phosphotransferase family protein [Actinoplanes regularis]|uniref:Predicted kinase, aminoglycoside phosphotransferase (APT) family n=1 Tax=Actinoplanes regularis TaxID=52697 RepID=A0A239IMU6_9ACTN|nr:aminoglycoside phosphotransferase family protein [Actinoplanes regularis]GIE91439.1 aminoglycoside phosphotransferase [Actinoplanes regularis]SNS94885.1 Predicted kinase, aminoglycoside phosphotransferase (APT) family [Actinoplanes regularis]